MVRKVSASARKMIALGALRFCAFHGTEPSPTVLVRCSLRSHIFTSKSRTRATGSLGASQLASLGALCSNILEPANAAQQFDQLFDPQNLYPTLFAVSPIRLCQLCHHYVTVPYKLFLTPVATCTGCKGG